MRYNRKQGVFETAFEADTSVARATEIFVPDAIFPADYTSAGEGFMSNNQAQIKA